jgi:hypothetical protein
VANSLFVAASRLPALFASAADTAFPTNVSPPLSPSVAEGGGEVGVWVGGGVSECSASLLADANERPRWPWPSSAVGHRPPTGPHPNLAPPSGARPNLAPPSGAGRADRSRPARCASCERDRCTSNSTFVPQNSHSALGPLTANRREVRAAAQHRPRHNACCRSQ